MDIRGNVEGPLHKSYQHRFLYNAALIISHFLNISGKRCNKNERLFDILVGLSYNKNNVRDCDNKIYAA